MLAEFVILDMNCGNSSAFEGADGSPDIGGIEPAVFSIGDDRHIYRIDDASSVIYHLVHRDKSHVRQAQPRRRCGVATDVDRRKPMTLDQLRADRIMGSRHNQSSRHSLWHRPKPDEFLSACPTASPLRSAMPGRMPRAPRLRLGQTDIDDGLAGREHPFAEQEQRMKSVSAFCVQFPSTGSPSDTPPLAFELGQLNLLNRCVVLRADVDRQPRQEHGWNEIPYVRRLSHHVLAARDRPHTAATLEREVATNCKYPARTHHRG